MSEEKDLVEGFNAGYIIEKHRPELAKQLLNAVDGVELPFVEGFVAGSQEYAKERTQMKTISKLRNLSKGRIPKPTKDKDKDKGIDMDR
jgi:hypothetical protein